MTTTRRPVKREPRVRITDAAIALFKTMQGLDWGCKEWWDLHSLLHDELQRRPWQFPCIERPDSVSGYPEGSWADKNWRPDEEARETYGQLEAAARAR
jgi:hypothetical protein